MKLTDIFSALLANNYTDKIDELPFQMKRWFVVLIPSLAGISVGVPTSS